MSSVGGVGSTAASSDGSYGDNSVSSDSDSELSRPSNSESWDSDRAGDNDSSSSLSQSTVDQLASGPTTSDSIAAQPTISDDLASSMTTTDQLASMGSTGNRSNQDEWSAGASDVATDASVLGQVNVGFNAPIQGVSVNGQSVVDPMRFGKYSPGTQTPNLGATLDTFSKPDFNIEANKFDLPTHMAKQSMISSQSTFEHARTIDPGLANTVFEVRTPTAGVSRTYDARISIPGTPDTYIEMKAGKSLNGGQLAKDTALARKGVPVDYAYANNPITNNHGPDAANQASLDRATNATGGKLTSNTVDVDVTRQFDNVVTASRFSSVARSTGKVLGPAAAVMDGYNIYSAVQADGGFGPQAKAAVGEAAGGWAGAATVGFAGAKSGAVVGSFIGGPAGAAVGAVVGGVGGAVVGALGGSAVGRTISGWFS